MSSGDIVYPKELEAKLRMNPLIENAAIFGDDKEYLTALVCLDPKELESFCKEKKLDPKQLNSRELKKELKKNFKKLNEDQRDPNKVLKYRILPGRLSLEEGERTPLRNIRKSSLKERHPKELESMYRVVVPNFDCVLGNLIKLSDSNKSRDKDAFLTKKENKWKPISWSKMMNRSKKLSKALIANQVKPQQKVLIISGASPQSSISYVGTQMAGGVPVVLPPEITVDDLELVARETESPIIFVERKEDFDKLQKHRNRFPNIKKIVCLDENEKRKEKDLVPLKEFKLEGELVDDSEVESRILNLRPDQPATVVYKDLGITKPRGVVLSHESLNNNSRALNSKIKLGEESKYLSTRPLSELNEQILSVCVPSISGSKVYFPETSRDPKENTTKKLIENMRDVKPGVVALRRREWKNISSEVPPEVKEKLKEKERFGLENCFSAISIDGPLPKENQRNLDQLELPFSPVHEEVEAGGFISLSTANPNVSGKPLEGMNIEISKDKNENGHGEVLVSCPSLFSGYLGDPKLFGEKVKDGKLRTGKLGELDKDGNLRIIGPKLDSIKFKEGKQLDPFDLEREITAHPFIDDSVVFLNDESDEPVALLSPNLPALENYAKENNLELKDLFSSPTLKQQLEKHMEKVNKDLPDKHKVKRFALLSTPLSYEMGEVSLNGTKNKDKIEKTREKDLKSLKEKVLLDYNGKVVPPKLHKDWIQIHMCEEVTKNGLNLIQEPDTKESKVIKCNNIDKIARGAHIQTEDHNKLSRANNYFMNLGDNLFEIPNHYLRLNGKLNDSNGKPINEELVPSFKKLTNTDKIQEEGLSVNEPYSKPIKIYSFSDLKVGNSYLLENGKEFKLLDEQTLKLEDATIEIPLELQGGHCTSCQASYNKWRKKIFCKECKEDFCSCCIDDHAFKSLGDTNSNFICDHCLIKVKERIEKSGKELPERFIDSQRELNAIDLELAGNITPLPHQDFSISQSKDIESGKIACKCCTKKFSFNKQPIFCVKCENIVCNQCVTSSLRFIPRVMGFPRSKQICRSCWPEIKLELKDKLQLYPEFADLVETETNICESKLKEEPENFEEPKLSQKRCQLCNMQFTFMKGCKKCDECSKVVCGSCCGSFLLPKKSKKKPQTLCTKCLPPLSDLSIERMPRGILEPIEYEVSLTPNQDKLIEQSKTCKCCNNVFNFLRRPEKCQGCSNDVCRYCSKLHRSNVFKKEPTKMCIECLQKQEGLLEEKLKDDPSLSEAKFELEAIRLLEENEKRANKRIVTMPLLSVEKVKKCDRCGKKSSFFRKCLKCPECSENVCTSCSLEVTSVVLSWNNPKNICEVCIPNVEKKIEMAEVPKGVKKGDHQALILKDVNQIQLSRNGNLDLGSGFRPSEEEEKSIEKGKVKCKVCNNKFSFFRPPHKCNKCDQLVCWKCSRNLSALASVLRLTNKKPCICKSCWPETKKALQLEIEQSPSLKASLDLEIELAEKTFEAEPLHPLESIKGLKENSLAKKKCNSCQNKFNIFDQISCCDKCNQLNCGSCSGKFLVPQLNKEKFSTICTPCLPSVKIEKPQLLSDEKEDHEIQLLAQLPLSLDLDTENKIKLKPKCEICVKDFNFFRRPHDCSRCKRHVCRSCSTGNFVSLILNIKNSRICNKCLPELKTEIFQRLKMDPSSYSQCKRELYLLDMALKGEGSDRNYDILSGATTEKSFQLRMKSDQKIQKKLEKLKCGKCHKHMKWLHWDDLLDIYSVQNLRQRNKKLKKIDLALFLLEQEEEALKSN